MCEHSIILVYLVRSLKTISALTQRVYSQVLDVRRIAAERYHVWTSSLSGNQRRIFWQFDFDLLYVIRVIQTVCVRIAIWAHCSGEDRNGEDRNGEDRDGENGGAFDRGRPMNEWQLGQKRSDSGEWRN